MIFIHLSIILILLSITWQDFKYRAVYWFLFPFLMILCIAKDFYNHLFSFDSAIFNLGIITLQVSILHIYYFIKKGNWLLHDIYLGWGDVLFFIALALIFPPVTFLAFQLLSLILVLLLFTIFNKLLAAEKGIPLAGCQSFLLAMVLIIQSAIGINALEIENLILEKLNNAYAY